MDFLKKIKWSIGEEETRAIFRDKQSRPSPSLFNEMEFIDFTYGIPAKIGCHLKEGWFGREKLVQVNVNFFFEKLPEDDIIEKKYIQIKSDLLAQYGKPASEGEELRLGDGPPSFPQSDYLVWFVGDSTLTLSFGLRRDGIIEAYCGIHITYGDSKRDPYSRQWNWLRAK